MKLFFSEKFPLRKKKFICMNLISFHTIFLCISRKTNVCVRRVWIIKILLLQSIRIKFFFPSFRVKPNFIEAGRYGREMNKKKQQRYWLFLFNLLHSCDRNEKNEQFYFIFVCVYGDWCLVLTYCTGKIIIWVNNSETECLWW